MRYIFKNKSKQFILLMVSLLFVAAFIDNVSNDKKSITPSISPQILKPQNTLNFKLEFAKVVAVIDGDTIDVDLGEGNIKRVRYIGIDTPESVDPRRPVQCFSKESTSKNKELVENKIVGLEKDVSDTDKFGRLLRYVYVDNLFVNMELVSQGYATAASFPPDIKYQSEFKKEENIARKSKKGLWGDSCLTDSKNENPKP